MLLAFWLHGSLSAYSSLVIMLLGLLEIQVLSSPFPLLTFIACTNLHGSTEMDDYKIVTLIPCYVTGSVKISRCMQRYYLNYNFVYVDDHKKLAHLWKLEGAKERLQLVKAELTEEGSFDNAIFGCAGVFHTASPVLGRPTSDPKARP